MLRAASFLFLGLYRIFRFCDSSILFNLRIVDRRDYRKTTVARIRDGEYI